MNKYKKIPAALAEGYDKLTKEMLRQSDLLLALSYRGDREAPFLRALCRKAEALGFLVTSQAITAPTVTDREAYAGVPPFNTDIDAVCGGSHYWIPAVSFGLLRIIQEAELDRKNICIVGRGHAVKGLDAELLAADHTVTVCHSKTDLKTLADHIARAEVLVMATPELPDGLEWPEAELILDVSGVLGGAIAEACDNYVGPGAIGRLTTSILCNRAALWYGL